MNRTRISIAVLACALASPAFAAGSMTNTSNTTNASNLNATTAATGGMQSITSNGAGSVRTVPNMAGNSFYGSFSQDNCMVSAGGGITVLGFGANGVTPIRDDQCDRRRSFERIEQAAAMQQNNREALHQVADDVLCSLGGPVYISMKAHGLCSAVAIKEEEEGSRAALAMTEQPTKVADNTVHVQSMPMPPSAGVQAPAQAQATTEQPKIKVLGSPNPVGEVSTYVIDASGTHPVGQGHVYEGPDPIAQQAFGKK